MVSDEQAANNRTHVGGYTFNAFPPEDYEGRIVVFAVIRLGDHAHIEVESGRQVPSPNGPTLRLSGAGRLCFAWEDWLHLRTMLAALPWTRIAEVENPTPAQLVRHTASSGVTDYWYLCCECGYVTAADSWLSLNYNPAYEDEPYEPMLILADSDPSICRCPVCEYDHTDSDSGAGFYDGSREAMIAKRDELEREGWAWDAA